MSIQRLTFLCLIILCLDICLSQKDCTGVDCPVLESCIEEVLERGACCATCAQKGCTCEGYQYYDCVNAGFKRGKVPEGESYFVDFGSTECSCPLGGGKIICHFIPCPEIPPNCIDILQPEDGCPHCGRIGCVHDNKKYEAGHSFQMDQCHVCHCPNDGGNLMCSLIPGCHPHSSDKPMLVTTTENSSHLRDTSRPLDSRQRNPLEQFSKLASGNTLPLYKQDPPSFGTEDYDYTLAEPTSSSPQDLARPLESTTVPPTYPESSSTSLSLQDDRRHELQEKQKKHDPERRGKAEVQHKTDYSSLRAQKDTSVSSTTATTQEVTTENLEVGERTVRLSSDRDRVVCFSRAVSAKELVKVCCETGVKWATANGHCNNMEPPTMDRHSICWTAQTQCCLGSLKENRCLAGINAAKKDAVCEEASNDKCPTDSYKECCSCCSLGLQFRSEGHRCEAHQHLGYHCRHIFLTCCEGEEREKVGARERDGWHTVKERPALDTTALPKKGIDMDECLVYLGNLCEHRCINTPGSFRCECFTGYVLQEDGLTCAPGIEQTASPTLEDDRALVEPTTLLPPPTQPPVPLNPCEGNGPCMQQCTPVGGRPQCSCYPGFSLTADGQSCEESSLLDYLYLSLLSFFLIYLSLFFYHTLEPFPSLSLRSFPCCPFCSLFLHTDINECLSTRACQPNERCVNTAGSYMCQRQIVCPSGYQINNDICEDINECVQMSHNCGLGFECVNTEGSFRCDPKPHCPVGFSQDSQGNCIDIDECGTVAQPCSPGFNCVNTVGSYTCQRKILMCSRGYHASPDASRCIDVDECQSNLHRCGEGQLCHNLPGSYRCDCQTGYQYDTFRRMCVDVNECWRYPGRLCAQTCENTPGSYECSCTAGFRLSSDGKNCEDVNECLASPCSQECANIYGSYQCYCRQGYYLREDGHTCEDIDECSQSIGHLCTYKCVNVPGSYQCACPEYGYTMSPNGRSCRDIDECATRAHNCSVGETCYNIQGGYRCLAFSCPQNYRKVSDTRCERISCPSYLDCQNSPLRITYYYLSFQSNIVIPAQIFRIGPSPAYSGDNVIVSITRGNEENYFSTRKLNAYTGAVYLHRQVREPRDFSIDVEMKLWRQGTFTTFLARIYVFITANSL
uniref:Fibulin 2 n=1 Tax=Myripristis murdjan TaxID=586833 RepID=A0A667ZCL5_9TELE